MKSLNIILFIYFLITWFQSPTEDLSVLLVFNTVYFGFKAELESFVMSKCIIESVTSSLSVMYILFFFFFHVIFRNWIVLEMWMWLRLNQLRKNKLLSFL